MEKRMDDALSIVTDWLLCASSQVGSNYFQLPVAGQEDPEYRERVYCYELYHRWRTHWPEGFPFTLSGEIDKSGHPLIRGEPKPDFLVHVPGKMTNLLIVEVKPFNRHFRDMVIDLKKLTRFRRNLVPLGQPGNYHAAYFWVYGLQASEWPAFRNHLLQEVNGSPEFDCALVSAICHERAGDKAVKVPWG
jgi:hypothetical protein